MSRYHDLDYCDREAMWQDYLREQEAEYEALYHPATEEEIETAVYFDGHFYRPEEPKEA